jgi:hypothetical protein
MRKPLIALTLLAALAFYAAGNFLLHPLKAHGAEPSLSPASTPISEIAIVENNQIVGVVIVTADGKLHAIPGFTKEQAEQVAKALPKGNVAGIVLDGDCAPKQST